VTKITNANAPRIAWFVALQKVMNFPKYFFAPLASVRHRYRAPGQQPEGSAFLPRIPTAAFSWMQSQAASTTPKTVLPSFLAPNTPAYDPVVGRSRPQRATYPWGQATKWMLNNTSMAAPAPSNPLLADEPKTNFFRKNIGFSQIRFRRFLLPPAASFVPPQRSAPALAATFPTQTGRGDPPADSSPQPERWLAVGSKVPATAGSRFAEQPAPEPDFASQADQSTEGSSDKPADSHEQDHHRSVTMLHIDGSALGRWAIQHLGRTLGKPASGMTSVDPRASVPRSRVAPF